MTKNIDYSWKPFKSLAQKVKFNHLDLKKISDHIKTRS